MNSRKGNDANDSDSDGGNGSTIMIVSYNNVNGEHSVDYDDHGDDSGDDDGCVPRVTQGRPRNLPQGQKR